MFRPTWLCRLQRRVFSTPVTTRKARPRRRTARLMLESLESRIVPAIQVFNPGDATALINDLQTASNTPKDTTIINLQANTTYLLTAVNNSWYGPTGLPPIDSNVIIHGNGAVIARDVNPSDNTPNFRLLYVSGGMELPPGELTMDNIELQGGVAKGGDGSVGGSGLGAGGAIFNQGTLNLTGVTLFYNEALGGSTAVARSNGGAGMGPFDGAFYDSDGSGFGGSLNGSYGGDGSASGSGGGFLNGANGTAGQDGQGGGKGGFGGSDGNDAGGGGDGGGGDGGGGVGGGGGSAQGENPNFSGGNFGRGGVSGSGVGAGGGFGGGGGDSFLAGGGNGGFGGGGGMGVGSKGGGRGGFGGGNAGFDPANPSHYGGGGGAGLGGAIFNMGADSADAASGQAALVNCTLTGNTAQGGNGANGGSGYGAALFNLDGHVTLTNDTLDANAVAGGSSFIGGGQNVTGGPNGNGSSGSADGTVYNLAYGNDIDTGAPVNAVLTLNNDILDDTDVLASNRLANDLVSTSARAGFPLDAAAVTGRDNLVGNSDFSSTSTDANVITTMSYPYLGQLQTQLGGLTATILPGANSPALGAGDPSLAPATDQNGNPRPPNGPSDLGSVQVSVGHQHGPPAAPGVVLGGNDSTGSASPGQVLNDIANLEASLSANDANAVNANVATVSNDIQLVQTSASTAAAADRMQIDNALFSAALRLIVDGMNDLLLHNDPADVNIILEGIAAADQALIDWAQTELSSVVASPAGASIPGG